MSKKSNMPQQYESIPGSVLIVDDNPAKLVALAAALEGMDVRIATANSGTEALRHLMAQDFAVVLLDVNMPVMDGFETATMIRSRERSAHLPIVFVTAERLDDDTRLKGYELGAVDYILSPVLPQILRAKVETFANLHRMREVVVRQNLDLANSRAELQRLNEILETKVRERTQEIATLLAAEKQKADQIQELFDANVDGLLVVDSEGWIVAANPAARQLLGKSGESLFGAPFGMPVIAGEVAELSVPLLSGSTRFLEMRSSDAVWEGRPAHLTTLRDTTEKKRMDELIWTQANFDALTSLPNRRMLADRLQQVMLAGTRSGRKGALLALDLDHFKKLNDNFGHAMGDQLLVEVARRLHACLRAEDTVARMGGDEFVVVLGNLSSDPQEVSIQTEQIAEKIRHDLSQPYQLGATEYRSSASIGVVLFQGQLISQERLLAHVDSAMYQAKAKGRGQIHFFDAAMQDALEKRNQLEDSLGIALAGNQFVVHYQLQVDSKGSPVGVEALLRWRHPELGMVLPTQFISLAEETGMILSIGQWVLETACRQLASWQASSPLSRLSIAVNVSARQFRDPGFVSAVQDALRTHGVLNGLLKLELTESMVLDNVADSIAKMVELKKSGVVFAMDDFGTGYSSLSYLSRLPMDQLKIDQSFVSGVLIDAQAATIVQTIIVMALGLGLEIIAEGVETQEQQEFLASRGCQFFQGFFYGRPVDVTELELELAGA